ncbi:MAG: DUF3021 family protein [Lachnospiraceae bacterium]|nr:DUF3021 family protein [Lachnospiraceae bacterium]
MKDLIKTTIHYFAVITVVVNIVSATYISIFFGPNEKYEVSLIWQILFVSFMCSLCNVFFYQKEQRELPKKQMVVRWSIAYIYVNTVVLGFGVWFHWFKPDSLPMVIGMLLAIMVAFFIIAGMVYLFDLRTADQMNQRLKERSRGE